MNGKVKLILKKGIHSLSPSSSLLDQKSADFSIKGQIVNIFGSVSLYPNHSSYTMKTAVDSM